MGEFKNALGRAVLALEERKPSIRRDAGVGDPGEIGSEDDSSCRLANGEEDDSSGRMLL